MDIYFYFIMEKTYAHKEILVSGLMKPSQWYNNLIKKNFEVSEASVRSLNFSFIEIYFCEP
jgi:hypothetical protein